VSEIWKKRLLPGSFRGIPFFLDSHDLSGGRKAISHEPVDRDSTFSEDTGIKSKTYSIEGHVLGDNYFFIRDALITAMDNRDVGILIHPYLGLVEVRPGSYSFSEDTKEGRIATFNLRFIEAGDPSFPLAAIDSITKAIGAVVVAVAQVQNVFQLAFKIAELPGFALSGAESLVTKFFSDIKTGIKNVSLKPEEQATILKKIEEAEQATPALVQNPASLAAEIDSIIASLSGAVSELSASTTIDTTSGRDEKIAVFDAAINFTTGYASIPTNTPTRIKERDNAKALQDLIVQIGLARLTETIVEKDFTSSDQALAARESVSSKIVEQLLTADDESYQVLNDLNSSLIEAVPNPNENLASISSLVLEGETPSLVLAYDLYENQTLENDIIKRNKIRNPGFISGSVEVLSG